MNWYHKNFSWRACHFQTIFRMILVNCWIIWKKLHGAIAFPNFLQNLQREFKREYFKGLAERENNKKRKRREQQRNYYHNKKRKQLLTSNP